MWYISHANALIILLPLKSAVGCLCCCVLVLTAINEDSPTVPALLTDYILNGACISAAAQLY